MVAASIEQLKRDYTDKYVKVDGSRPELARFQHLVGQVKTVNMSRRALVEFLDYHLNIGWYDIDLSFLTIVEKPSEEELAAKKAEAKKPADKPEAKAAPKAEAKPAAKASAKPAAGGGAKMSVADMLAAARGGGPAAAKPAAPKAKSADAPAKPAAKPAAPAAKSAAGGKLSVAEMLAAARAGAGAAPAAKPAPAEEAAEEETVAAAPPAKPAKAAAPKASGGRVDRSTMSVADMIAYCREHDAG